MKKLILGLMLLYPLCLCAQDSLFNKMLAASPQELEQLIKTYPDSLQGLGVLYSKMMNDRASSATELAQLAAGYNLLSDHVRTTERGKALNTLLNNAQHLVVGATLPDFTANNVNKEAVSLASLRGKYVLVDFWASWCIPCRKEFPFLKKAYARFKDKGFEILGYSLDDKERLWVSAVENDDTPWIQLSALKGYKDPVVTVYNVQFVPQNWLIDPSGKVIARNLRGENVEKELEKLIK